MFRLFVPSPIGQDSWIFDISVVNDSIVWVRDTNADSISITTNGGVSWKYYDVAEAKGRASLELFAIDSLTAWFSTNRFENTDTRPIFKTIDGGLTWKKIETPSAAGGNLIHFFDKNDGIVINGTSAAVSKNGGENWTKISASKYALRTNEFLVVSGTATSRAAGSQRPGA